MKKILLLLISLFFYCTTNAASLVYPIQEMSKLNDRWNLFSTLDSSQIRTLPIIDENNYSSIAKANWWYNDYTRIYTMLWWATYQYWWDVWQWWHWWIDIATAEWTPVYSIYSWKVIVAWDRWAWWKLVAIEHTINWKKIISSYAHLSNISVKYWDKINWDTKIWEVWSTGNSTWNHLHFQIDSNTAPFHPYYSNSQSFNQLDWYTIDPIAFLNSNWAVIKNIVKREDEIKIQWLLSREEIEAREIKEFLKYNNLSLTYNTLWNHLALWDQWVLTLKVESKSWRAFNWTLPWAWLEFEFDSDYLRLLPTKLIKVEKWYRDIYITPIKSWKMKVKALLWKQLIKSFYINIYNPNTKVYPTSWLVLWNSSLVIWDLKTWAVVLADSNNTNLINFKYSWDYKIYTDDNSIDFCIKRWSTKTISTNINKTCSTYSKDISFNYEDTVAWILLYKYRINKVDSTKINLVNTYNDKLFNVKNIKWFIPNWLSKNYRYYNEIIKTLEESIVTIYSKWYFSENRDISQLDAINWITNSLMYAYNKTSNTNYRNLIEVKLWEIKSESKWKFTKIIKKDFLNLVWKYLVFNNIDNVDIINKYKDLSDYENKIINYIYTDSNFWKDEKFPTYFKSNENITRWEVSYMLHNILKF